MLGEGAWAVGNQNQWSRLEDKLFEQALVTVPEGLPDRWARIGQKVGKSAPEVEDHYNVLVHDVFQIDSGRVDLPTYLDELSDREGQISFQTKKHDADRKKGTPWSDYEHKLFLIGLSKYGKGDWRSISRNVVVTRTPTQVASHAQKFFLRQSSGKKERKRSSIHDITTPDMDAPLQQQEHRPQMEHQTSGFPPPPPSGEVGNQAERSGWSRQ